MPLIRNPDPDPPKETHPLLEIVRCNIVNLTVAPRDVHAENMDWTARLHVVTVEDRVARIPPYQTSVKTMYKHQ